MPATLLERPAETLDIPPEPTTPKPERAEWTREGSWQIPDPLPPYLVEFAELIGQARNAELPAVKKATDPPLYLGPWAWVVYDMNRVVLTRAMALCFLEKQERTAANKARAREHRDCLRAIREITAA